MKKIDIKHVQNYASLRNLERELILVKNELAYELRGYNRLVEALVSVSKRNACVTLNELFSHYEEVLCKYHDQKKIWAAVHPKTRKLVEEVVMFAEQTANEALSSLKKYARSIFKTNLKWKMHGNPYADSNYEIGHLYGKPYVDKTEHVIELTPQSAINLYLSPPRTKEKNLYHIGADDDGYYYCVRVIRGRRLSFYHEGDIAKEKILQAAERFI